MGTIDASDNTSLSGALSFIVHKYGDLSYTTTACENTGDEFNPIYDLDSPSDMPPATMRGAIDGVTVDLDDSNMQ